MNLKIVKPIKLQIIDRYFQSFIVTEISGLESCVIVKILWYSLRFIDSFRYVQRVLKIIVNLKSN